MTDPVYTYVRGTGWVTTDPNIITDAAGMRWRIVDRGESPQHGDIWDATNEPYNIEDWRRVYANRTPATDSRWRTGLMRIYDHYIALVPA